MRKDVWNFRIGGYQVCEKWLKDRKDCTLTKDDVAHYHKIVVALNEAIRLMKAIDEVIEQHGGWPGAFSAPEDADVPRVSLNELTARALRGSRRWESRRRRSTPVPRW